MLLPLPEHINHDAHIEVEMKAGYEKIPGDDQSEVSLLLKMELRYSISVFTVQT